MSQLATFAAGCFWGVEHIFRRQKGVIKATSGYMGGTTENPTYKEVCTGQTGHAEVVQVEFDPAQTNFKDLVGIFWRLHDPTTLNRQGVDVGTQYRSAIFYHNEEQKRLAQESKDEFDRSKVFSVPAVTEIVPAKTFYRAEEYHQEYFERNGGHVCHVLRPR